MLPLLVDRMSPNELKAVITALVAACAYFLIREFTRKDKIAADLESFRDAMNKTIKTLTDKFSEEIGLVTDRNTIAMTKLNEAVTELAISIADQKAWFSERYIHTETHEKAIGTLKEDIRLHAERFEKELERHTKHCPAMRG